MITLILFWIWPRIWRFSITYSKSKSSLYRFIYFKRWSFII